MRTYFKPWASKVKQWTPEEIKGLNYYRNLKMGDAEEVIRLTEKRFITIPVDLDRDTRQARINWLRDLGEGYFEAGLTIQGVSFDDPFANACTCFMLKLDPEHGFVPLFSTLYWEPKEGEVTEDGNKVRLQQDSTGESSPGGDTNREDGEGPS